LNITPSFLSYPEFSTLESHGDPEVITIVSGLSRSGISLMIQILETI